VIGEEKSYPIAIGFFFFFTILFFILLLHDSRAYKYNTTGCIIITPTVIRKPAESWCPQPRALVRSLFGPTAASLRATKTEKNLRFKKYYITVAHYVITSSLPYYYQRHHNTQRLRPVRRSIIEYAPCDILRIHIRIGTVTIRDGGDDDDDSNIIIIIIITLVMVCLASRPLQQ